MSNLAVTTASPKSIVWLIRNAEWNRLEEIITFNCAALGGYYNVVLPLAEDDTLTRPYTKFLSDYDPDLIVLAPGMKSLSLTSSISPIYPFSTVRWEDAGEFVSDDPGGGSGGTNRPVDFKEATNEDPFRRPPLIAVADKKYPDTSRLALVACGDIRPMRPLLLEMDGELDFNAIGYRELFLQRHLKPEHEWDEAGAHLRDDGVAVDAPERTQLEGMIRDEFKFPLSGAAAILRACCESQHHPVRRTFIGMTALYGHGGRELPERFALDSRPPAITILVSDTFALEEALLFWNIRANGTKVAWLSFAEVESELDELSLWLDSDYGGIFYALMVGNTSGISFSASKANLGRLRELVSALQEKRKRKYLEWAVIDFDDLVLYNFSRPHIKRERTSVMEGAQCAFVPPYPVQSITGVFGVTLDWDGLMLPPNRAVVDRLVSSKFVEGAFYRAYIDGKLEVIRTPQFRITKHRRLRAQVNNDSPIEFRRPPVEEIINTVFTNAGFSRVEASSVSRYHNEFIGRSGSLEHAALYLSVPPYRELLTLLADNTNKRLPGWLLERPATRRVLQHHHLLELFGGVVPIETKSYLDTVSDTLPEGAVTLLEKGLLERGFRLNCKVCSFTSWYPADDVGQTFKCARCFQHQVYRTNPLWLYKLPEVLFQGFAANMHVPLLALNHLKKLSKSSFGWAPDSDIYGLAGSPFDMRNVDLLFLSDGKLYVGEAKSNDSIDADQFAFYSYISENIPVDGVVFATSKSHWRQGTIEKIDHLKAASDKEVIVLTSTELYSL